MLAQHLIILGLTSCTCLKFFQESLHRLSCQVGGSFFKLVPINCDFLGRPGLHHPRLASSWPLLYSTTLISFWKVPPRWVFHMDYHCRASANQMRLTPAFSTWSYINLSIPLLCTFQGKPPVGVIFYVGLNYWQIKCYRRCTVYSMSTWFFS